MKSRKFLPLLLAFTGAFAACSSHNASLGPRRSNIDVLSAALANLNVADPVADLDKNLGAGDHRFLCMFGFSVEFPGVPDQERSVVEPHGQRCVEGTSDVIEGGRYLQLLDQARRYTTTYNAELLRRIKNGTVT